MYQILQKFDIHWNDGGPSIVMMYHLRRVSDLLCNWQSCLLCYMKDVVLHCSIFFKWNKLVRVREFEFEFESEKCFVAFTILFTITTYSLSQQSSNRKILVPLTLYRQRAFLEILKTMRPNIVTFFEKHEHVSVIGMEAEKTRENSWVYPPYKLLTFSRRRPTSPSSTSRLPDSLCH